MKYISTRNKNYSITSAEAIRDGLANDGGLFVPQTIPALSKDDFAKLCEMSYEERAAFVLSKFLEDYTYEELLGYTTNAYSRFYGEDPCPLVNVDENLYVLELWHGPTCAFKDMALTMLPHLLVGARKKTGESSKTLILVATSGDTGKAALEGFRDVEGVDIIVFYPSQGVSDMQKLQMRTQLGNNVYVCAIEGNFDDAQSAVKQIFNDDEIKSKLLKKNYKLSSANSINWGRLAPQIAYYISAYCDLLNFEEIEFGDKINFCVPSGNFGNILAGYYAYKMGLPVNKFICASNSNKVLTDFFKTGTYDRNREFFKTMSPSMDILISSNLERLLFDISGQNDVLTKQRMEQLKAEGKYTISKEELAKIQEIFDAGFTTEEETKAAIFSENDFDGYVMDTHTAVAMSTYDEYQARTEDETPAVIVSTASAYKFPSDVLEAITGEKEKDAFEATKKLNEETALEIPEPLKGLKDREIRFSDIIDKKDVAKAVLDYIDRK